ncbi:MAG: hypothetical protein ABUR63_06200, partial [Verrucomicrobiota bacterium]
TGGAWFSAGGSGFGGFGGAAGGWGTGTGGAFGAPLFPDGGTCSAPTLGPLSTADAPRPFGWTFSGTPATTSTGAAGAGGWQTDAGAGPARCVVIPDPYPGVSCVGEAHLHGTPSGPVIVFDDGSQLAWDGTLPKALTPAVQQTDGGIDSVWVDYERRTVVVCPFCGAYTTNRLQIRDGASGAIRFYDQSGAVLPDMTDAQITELFGVGATALHSCTFPTYAGCYSFLRTEYDHELRTSPPQTIIDATLTPITAPKGTFEVIWASSWESYSERAAGCPDGPAVATDTGFVANRLSP